MRSTNFFKISIWLFGYIYIYKVGIDIIGFWQNIIIYWQENLDLAMEIIFNVTINNYSKKRKKMAVS
jgi:hypothetical protein